jgi:hypothetical protein
LRSSQARQAEAVSNNLFFMGEILFQPFIAVNASRQKKEESMLVFSKAFE